MQLLMPPAPVVHLVDVFSLQGRAFNTVGTTGKTLKILLESDQYVKVFFDVRNDSDALFSHFGVALKGVIELQLVEYASRPMAGRLIKGLAKCISEDCDLSLTERRQWSLVKEAGRKLFVPERGGSYVVFNGRPLPDALKDYCVQDVLVLPKLLSAYAASLQPHLASQVRDESRKRVAQSQAAHFNGKGRHMALAPSFSWKRYVDDLATDSRRPGIAMFYTNLNQANISTCLALLCSTDLSKYCAMYDSMPVIPREEESSNAVPEQPASSMPDHPGSAMLVQPESSVHTSPGSSVPISYSLSSPHDLTTEVLQQPGKPPVVDEDRYAAEEEEKDDEEDDDYEPQGYACDRGNSDEKSEKDYTACSASDCGYCGHCGY